MASEPSDEALAARVARKDIAAFAIFYDRYARRVYAWSAHMVGTAEAEDVVQESFLRLWDKAAQFDARRGRFASWFLAIARHEVIRQLRRRGLDRRVIAADEIERVLADAGASNRELEEEAWARESAAAVLGALASLPTEQRRVITLAYCAGLTQSAIAKVTGAPLARERAEPWKTCMIVNAEGVVLGRMYGKDLDADPNARVADVMSPGPSTFRPNVSVVEMLEYMDRTDLETAPVTTPDGKLLGLVVRADVKRAASRKG